MYANDSDSPSKKQLIQNDDVQPVKANLSLNLKKTLEGGPEGGHSSRQEWSDRNKENDDVHPLDIKEIEFEDANKIFAEDNEEDQL